MSGRLCLHAHQPERGRGMGCTGFCVVLGVPLVGGAVAVGAGRPGGDASAGSPAVPRVGAGGGFGKSFTVGIVMLGNVNFASRCAFASVFGRATTRYRNMTLLVPPCISCTAKPVALLFVT
jgi:hypothetical protein